MGGETGRSPAKAVENLRLEAARLMMEHNRHPIDVIARQTGFAGRDRMPALSCAPSDSRRKRSDETRASFAFNAPAAG